MDAMKLERIKERFHEGRLATAAEPGTGPAGATCGNCAWCQTIDVFRSNSAWHRKATVCRVGAGHGEALRGSAGRIGADWPACDVWRPDETIWTELRDRVAASAEFKHLLPWFAAGMSADQDRLDDCAVLGDWLYEGGWSHLATALGRLVAKRLEFSHDPPRDPRDDIHSRWEARFFVSDALRPFGYVVSTVGPPSHAMSYSASRVQGMDIVEHVAEVERAFAGARALGAEMARRRDELIYRTLLQGGATPPQGDPMLDAALRSMRELHQYRMNQLVVPIELAARIRAVLNVPDDAAAADEHLRLMNNDVIYRELFERHRRRVQENELIAWIPPEDAAEESPTMTMQREILERIVEELREAGAAEREPPPPTDPRDDDIPF